MGNIFVSYSRVDTKVVDRLVRKLEILGHHVWLDRNDIQGGEQWRREIVRGIEQADALILVISPAAVQSDNVRKELDVAQEAATHVLPVVVEDATIPDEMKYQLAGIQKIDFASDFTQGFSQLTGVIGGELNAPLRGIEQVGLN